MRKELVFPILALAVLIAILVVGGVFTGTTRFVGRGVTLALNEKGKPWGPLPDGPQTYQVVSPEDAWPKFSETTINPLKVYPGDTQRMRVVVQDRVEVSEVIAEIETDNGINEVPLRLAGESAVTQEDILKQRYIVQEGKLIMLGDLDRMKLALAGLVRHAEAADVRKFVFEGEWVVKDTHVRTYHTTFRAKNASGEENSITMAWSDPCSGIVDGANSTLAGNCTIGTNVTDGIDGGSLNLGGYAVTLAGSGSTFVWNSGQNLTINGSIVINTGAQLRQTNLWINDQDGDGYVTAGGPGQLAQDAQPPGGYIRRSTTAPGASRTTGPLRAGTVSSVTGVSGAWSNPGQGSGSDNLYATASVPFIAGIPPNTFNVYYSRWLEFSDFPLDIPGNATITSITIQAEKSYSGSLVSSTAVLMTKPHDNGVVYWHCVGCGSAATSLNIFGGGNWSTTDTILTYTCNQPSCLFSAGDLNRPDFRIAVSGAVNTGGSATLRVDDLVLTVNYTVPGYQGVGDCYEADPATTRAELAFPGQTIVGYEYDRGDGSFDYDCSGSVVKSKSTYTDGCNCQSGIDYCAGVISCNYNQTTPACGQGFYDEFNPCSTVTGGTWCENQTSEEIVLCK